MLSPVTKAAEQGQSGEGDALMAYPEGGYWAVAPGPRLRMLRALCCDALDTAIIRCALTLALDSPYGTTFSRTDRAGQRIAPLSLLSPNFGLQGESGRGHVHER